MRFQLPTLRSAADAASAMTALTAAVAAGEVTPGEAAELSKLVETYMTDAQGARIDQRLRAFEERNERHGLSVGLGPRVRAVGWL